MTLRWRVQRIIAHALANPESAHMAMPITEPWTIQQLDRLPDDCNRYEVLDGELLVTPPPTEEHEAIVASLTMALVPFVQSNGLGLVHHPQSIVRTAGSQVEPDLMVRPIGPFQGWENAPLPILVVEVTSHSTRHRDLWKKRDFYVRSGIEEYWIVDRDEQMILQIRGTEERRVSTVLRWSPGETGATLEVDVERLFAEVKARM
jgi:Uma2 family endonuclease